MSQAEPNVKAGERFTAGIRRRLVGMRYVPAFLKIIWETHRPFTVAMIALRLSRALFPVATLFIAKLIIDAVIGMRGKTTDLSHLWKLVALEIAVVFLNELLTRASSLVETLLGDLVLVTTSVKLMSHAATLDLYQFESPDFHDQLERARRQSTGRVTLITQILGVGQDLLTLFSLGAALMFYNPWLVLLLVVAILPAFFGETHYASLEYRQFFRRAPERRLLDYIRFLGASDENAKEVQIFGLAPWLIDRYRALSEQFVRENRNLSIRKSISSTLLALVGMAGYYTAYVLILIRAVTGGITIGTLTFLSISFLRSRDLLQRVLMSASDIYEQSLYLKDLFDFLERKPNLVSRPGALPVPETIKEGFVFRDVGFQYPGSDVWALRHINLIIRPDERLAFVGENGAGKTTMTKLIGRLYDPTEGAILLEGVDLREYDLASVRKAVGVIFQDFVRYTFRIDENIGVGEIDKVKEYLDLKEVVRKKTVLPQSNKTIAPAPSKPVPQSIVKAAEQSLAATLIGRFDRGYRQMLGRRFEGGVDLSGGEWQKIALARAYMRDAQVIILDEPTAALDARAEYEVFTRFSQLLIGRMAIIISHRFSTVRMADRIVVLNQGRIVESGTHAELVESGGIYSDLFSLQAEGYR
jgi:ATP-binding cassette subfamily B protein